MKKLLWLALVFITAGLLLPACRPGVLLSPTPEVKTPAPKPVAPVPKAAWEQKWESALVEAKKEGVLSVYTIWRPETRIAVGKAFKEKYGIDVEFMPFGRGADLLAKVKAEQRAGLYFADVFGAGNPTFIVMFKPEGLLGPIEPLLILPEVLDPNVWRGGKVPLTDKEGLALSLIASTIRTVVYNTDLIKEGEITNYKDLLKPQYKDKITMNDPAVTGAGNAAFTHLGHTLWGEAGAIDFLRRLIKEQGVVFQRDNRIHVEWVARGKYAIALAPNPDSAFEFLALGAPVKLALVEEDNRITASAGAMGVPTKFAHPNATVVFINWLLTKEGQTIFARSWGSPATRLDASTEGIEPLYIPIPGKKYYLESEEALEARGRWLEIAQKIVAETMK